VFRELGDIQNSFGRLPMDKDISGFDFGQQDGFEI